MLRTNLRLLLSDVSTCDHVDAILGIAQNSDLVLKYKENLDIMINDTGTEISKVQRSRRNSIKTIKYRKNMSITNFSKWTIVFNAENKILTHMKISNNKMVEPEYHNDFINDYST